MIKKCTVASSEEHLFTADGAFKCYSESVPTKAVEVKFTPTNTASQQLLAAYSELEDWAIENHFDNQHCANILANIELLRAECSKNGRSIEETVKASLNSLKQLKAQIAIQVSKVSVFPRYNIPGPVQKFIDAMRKLSAD